MPGPKHVEYMAFPRVTALAEVVVDAQGAKDFADFSDALASIWRGLQALDVNFRPLDPAPDR